MRRCAAACEGREPYVEQEPAPGEPWWDSFPRRGAALTGRGEMSCGKQTASNEMKRHIFLEMLSVRLRGREVKAGCKISQKQPAVVRVEMLLSILQKEGKRSVLKMRKMICEIKVHLASNSIFSKSSSAQDTAGCSCTHVALGEAVSARHFGGASPQHLTVQHYMPVHPVRVSICLLEGRNIRCTG